MFVVQQLLLRMGYTFLQDNRSALFERLQLFLEFQTSSFSRRLAFFYQPINTFTDTLLQRRAGLRRKKYG